MELNLEFESCRLLQAAESLRIITDKAMWDLQRIHVGDHTVIRQHAVMSAEARDTTKSQVTLAQEGVLGSVASGIGKLIDRIIHYIGQFIKWLFGGGSKSGSSSGSGSSSAAAKVNTVKKDPEKHKKAVNATAESIEKILNKPTFSKYVPVVIGNGDVTGSEIELQMLALFDHTGLHVCISDAAKFKSVDAEYKMVSALIDEADKLGEDPNQFAEFIDKLNAARKSLQERAASTVFKSRNHYTQVVSTNPANSFTIPKNLSDCLQKNMVQLEHFLSLGIFDGEKNSCEAITKKLMDFKTKFEGEEGKKRTHNPLWGGGVVRAFGPMLTCLAQIQVTSTRLANAMIDVNLLIVKTACESIKTFSKDNADTESHSEIVSIEKKFMAYASDLRRENESAAVDLLASLNR